MSRCHCEGHPEAFGVVDILAMLADGLDMLVALTEDRSLLREQATVLRDRATKAHNRAAAKQALARLQGEAKAELDAMGRAWEEGR